MNTTSNIRPNDDDVDETIVDAFDAALSANESEFAVAAVADRQGVATAERAVEVSKADAAADIAAKQAEIDADGMP